MSKIAYHWEGPYSDTSASLDEVLQSFDSRECSREQEDKQKFLACREIALKILSIKERSKAATGCFKGFRAELSQQLKAARKEILQYDYYIRWDVMMSLPQADVETIGSTTWRYGYSARREECGWG